MFYKFKILLIYNILYQCNLHSNRSDSNQISIKLSNNNNIIYNKRYIYQHVNITIHKNIYIIVILILNKIINKIAIYQSINNNQYL